MKAWTKKFIALAREVGALKFGRFELKSGRISPYFFNAGAFCDGAAIDALADCYADAIVAAMNEQGLEFDLIFGPAYKGIPLAATVAASLHRRHGVNVPVAYNRKEAKDHGEGGQLVGAAVTGRVLVIDDVLSAGTAFGQAREMVEAGGARVIALAVGLDRQERGSTEASAGAELQRRGIALIAVAQMADLITDLRKENSGPELLSDMLEYRENYGA